jgi:hypothetical protein
VVGAGVIAYSVERTAPGKHSNWLLWVISLVFVPYFALDPIKPVFRDQVGVRASPPP